MQKCIAHIWDSTYNTIYKCESGTSFFTREQDKNQLAKQTGQIHFDNLVIITKEGSSVEDFKADHAINAWYREKMWRVGGETSHKYSAKRARTNTGTINLARVTLSDLENDTAVMATKLQFLIIFFHFVATFRYRPFCPFPNFSCMCFLFYFCHSIKFIHSKK